MHDEHRPAFHAYRRFFLVCISLLMLLGGMLIWFWNGPGSALVASAPPFVIERQTDGSWPQVPSDAPGFAWSLDVSNRESKSNFTSRQSASHSKGARIASSSIAIFNVSTGPLADLISRGVIEGLQADDIIQSISYAPKGGSNPTGELAPDIIITIDAGDYHEETVIGSGTMSSKIKVTMSDQLARGLSMKISDQNAPHRVMFRMTLDSDTDIEQDGIATPNARLKATAKNLSDGILARTRESLDKLRLEHGLFPQLPATFYPEYLAVDASQFDITAVFTKDEPFRQLASWRDRLIHNHTWWQGQVAGDEQASVARISERLIEAGFERSGHSDYDFSYRLGSIEVELIPERIRQLGVIVRIPGQERELAKTTNLHVSYKHRATEGMRLAAFESVITDRSSPELLLLCSPAWSNKQRRRGHALVEALDLQDSKQLLRRAYLRHRADDEEGAADDLARAVTFANTSFKRGKTLQNARQEAKAWDITFTDKLTDRDWLLSIGLVELVLDDDPIELDVTADAPFRGFNFYNGLCTTIAVGLKRSKQGHWGGAFRVVGDSDSEYSDMSKGRSSHQIRGNTATTDFLDDPSDGVSRVRIQLR